MRRFGLPSVCVALLAACPAPAPAPEPDPCPAGQRRNDAGACEDILPGDCAAGSRPEVGSVECRPVGWTACGDGFAPAPSGWGCIDVQSESDCPEGTMPSLGRTDCVPVGWTVCPSGFSLSGSPSACEPVLPAVKCEGATREVIGSSDCAPIGDCAAAFPPANATLFVDPSVAADATHFRTLGAALAAAAAGATIAVEAGTYAENLAFSRPVTLAGRCPERVHLVPGDPLQAGLVADGVRDVKVSGFEVSGFLGGAAARSGGSLELTEVLLRDNSATGAAAIGLGPSGTPSSVKLTRSAVREMRLEQGAGYGLVALHGGSLEASETAVSDAFESAATASDGSAVGSGSAMHLVRVVLRDSRPISGPAYGGYVLNGGTLSLEESAVLRTQLVALMATGANSHLTALSTFVADSRSRSGGLYGSAAQAQNGASVELTRCSMRNLAGGAMEAVGTGATLKATSVTARGDAALRLGAACCGAWAYRGGAVELSGVALLDSPAIGLNAVGTGSSLRATATLVRGTQAVGTAAAFAGFGASAEGGALAVIESSALLDNAAAALAATTGAEVTLRGSVVRGGPTAKYGVTASNGALLTLVGSVVAGSYEGGVTVFGPATPASTSPVPARASISRCLIRDSRVNAGGQGGWGVAAVDGAQLDVHDSALPRNATVALTAVGAGTSLVLERTVLAETRSDGTGHFGEGLSLSEGATAEVHDSALVKNRVAGINLEDGAPNRLTVVDSLIAATFKNGDLFGHGIVVGSGGVADIRGTAIGPSEAIGLAVSGGAVNLRRSILLDNPVALHAQDGTTLETADALPDAPAAGELIVSTDTVLLRNAVRVGSGAIPLPPHLPAP